MRIRRRDLMKLGAGAASSALFSPSLGFAQTGSHDSGPVARGKRQKILVIGAGLSGLVTAYELTNEMERAHPGSKQNLEGLYVKIWHQDPWTKGALG